MSKEKQIEEMREDISCLERECRSYCKERKCIECHLFFARMDCQNHFIAEGLTAKGYRKASEVAREIFEDIETYMFYHENIPNTIYKTIDFNLFNAIKKKYTEGER